MTYDLANTIFALGVIGFGFPAWMTDNGLPDSALVMVLLAALSAPAAPDPPGTPGAGGPCPGMEIPNVQAGFSFSIVPLYAVFPQISAMWLWDNGWLVRDPMDVDGQLTADEWVCVGFHNPRKGPPPLLTEPHLPVVDNYFTPSG